MSNGLSRFILSTFEAVRTNDSDLEALFKATADAGINTVEMVFKDRAAIDELLPYFRENGLRAIVQDRAIGGIGDQYADPDETVMAQTLEHYRSFDDVIEGYYLWDEPVKEAFETCRKNQQLFTALAPDKLAFFNVFPSYGVYNWDSVVYDWKSNAYAQYIDDYLRTVKPSVLAMDHYPYRPTPTTLHHSDIWRDVGYCSLRARQENIPFWFYFEGVDMSTGTIGALTVPHIAAQMAGALAYNAKALSWFCSMGVFTDVPGNRLPEYDALRELNYRIRRTGDLLFTYTLRTVCHSDCTPEENEAYFASPLSELRPVTALPDGVLAAVFTDATDTPLLMLVNKDTTAPVTGTVKLESAVTVRTFDDRTGRFSAPTGTDTLAVTLAPGDWTVFRLER